MGRSKVKVRFIENDSARKASFRKRRLGLIKKMTELTTLCDLSGMCLIYSPADFDDMLPIVWPSKEAAEEMMKRFLDIPEIERSKKMTNQHEYLRDAILKAEGTQRREKRRIWDMELAYLMDEVHHGKGIGGLDNAQLGSLAWLLEEKLFGIRKRAEFVRTNLLRRESGVNREADNTIVPRNLIGALATNPTVHPTGESGCFGRFTAITEMRDRLEGNGVISPNVDRLRRAVEQANRDREMESVRDINLDLNLEVRTSIGVGSTPLEN